MVCFPQVDGVFQFFSFQRQSGGFWKAERFRIHTNCFVGWWLLFDFSLRFEIFEEHFQVFFFFFNFQTFRIALDVHVQIRKWVKIWGNYFCVGLVLLNFKFFVSLEWQISARRRSIALKDQILIISLLFLPTSKDGILNQNREMITVWNVHNQNWIFKSRKGSEFQCLPCWKWICFRAVSWSSWTTFINIFSSASGWLSFCSAVVYLIIYFYF